jgi:hypothetical protein
VRFVYNPKQSNIFSLIVTMLNFFGQQYILPLIFKSLYLFCIFLRRANAGGYKNRKLILTGAAALIWALLTSRNDLVFDNSPIKTYLQVLFRGTYWLRQWMKLQRREEAGKMLKQACGLLETLAMQIFAKFGWRFRNRIISS